VVFPHAKALNSSIDNSAFTITQPKTVGSKVTELRAGTVLADASASAGANLSSNRFAGRMPFVHPFFIDVHRAVRLAKRHGCKAEARHLLVQLHAFPQAMRMAESSEQGLQIVNEVWVFSHRCEHRLLS
jgi:hypothetical protein